MRESYHPHPGRGRRVPSQEKCDGTLFNSAVI
jgi:hypothetical protein